jgi:hypothetical protein
VYLKKILRNSIKSCFNKLRKVGGKPNEGMTVIYKRLYFIDFDYYEKYEYQLMGLVYVKNHHWTYTTPFKEIYYVMYRKEKRLR